MARLNVETLEAREVPAAVSPGRSGRSSISRLRSAATRGRLPRTDSARLGRGQRPGKPTASSPFCTGCSNVGPLVAQDKRSLDRSCIEPIAGGERRRRSPDFAVAAPRPNPRRDLGTANDRSSPKCPRGRGLPFGISVGVASRRADLVRRHEQPVEHWVELVVQPVGAVQRGEHALIFGPAPIGSLQNNIPGTFSLNRMTFDTAAPPYTISGNALNFVTSTSSVSPFIFQHSANTVTIGNNLVLNNLLTIDGTGSGTVTLSGTLSGAGGLYVSTPGMVILNSGSNSFGGDVALNSGTLRITNPTAIPGGRNVIALSGAVFNLGAATGSNAAAPLSGIVLSGGTFRVPVGFAEYYVDALALAELGGVPAAIDFSGSTNFRLHLTGATTGIPVVGNTTWTGGGTSSIQNDGSIAIAFATSSTITNSTRLLNGTGGRGFQLTGGGTLVLTNPGNTAHLEADGSTLEVGDMAYLGTGVTVLRRTTGSDPGTLKYTGATAVSSKQVLLGPGHSRFWVSNAATDLTLSGTIGEAASGLNLVVAGSGTLTLTGNNTFNRQIFVRDGAVLSVPVLPNGGVAGPLGISTNLPSNLTLGFSSTTGTLRYTGATATTDRGILFGSARHRHAGSDQLRDQPVRQRADRG